MKMSATISGNPLSVREREHIRNRIRQNEQALNGHIVVPGNRATAGEGMDSRRQGQYESFLRTDIKEDSGLLRAKIARDKKILDAGDPRHIDRKGRAKIEKQVQADSEFVQKHMCPQSLFYVKSDHPEFQKAIKACGREHTEQYKRVAGRLKTNMRRLDPDGDSNLERLRPKN